MGKYSEMLKDPRWQKKRLEILERDGWKCMSCGSKDVTLHVHHVFYIKGLPPWEAPDGFLLTLCESCHAEPLILAQIQIMVGIVIGDVWRRPQYFGGGDYETLLANAHFMIKD